MPFLLFKKWSLFEHKHAPYFLTLNICSAAVVVALMVIVAAVTAAKSSSKAANYNAVRNTAYLI